MIVNPESLTCYTRGLKQMQLAAGYPCTIKLSASQCGPFSKTDNALCCITKNVMPKWLLD